MVKIRLPKSIFRNREAPKVLSAHQNIWAHKPSGNRVTHLRRRFSVPLSCEGSQAESTPPSAPFRSSLKKHLRINFQIMRSFDLYRKPRSLSSRTNEIRFPTFLFHPDFPIPIRSDLQQGPSPLYSPHFPKTCMTFLSSSWVVRASPCFQTSTWLFGSMLKDLGSLSLVVNVI